MNRVLTFLFPLFAFCSFAQDTLFMMSYDTILAKVYAVNSEEIKYKKWTNLEGPDYFIAVDQVSKIVYPNGEFDEFNQLAPLKKFDKEEVTLVKLNGDEEQILLLESNEESIVYKKKSNPDGPNYYLKTSSLHKLVLQNSEVVYNPLKLEKKELVEPKKVTYTEEIVMQKSSYYYHHRKLSRKELKAQLRSINDVEVNALVNESEGSTRLGKTTGYFSIGSAIITAGATFVGLIALAANEGKEGLVFAGWSGVVTLVGLSTSSIMRPVAMDRLNRAVALYNQKVGNEK